MHIKKILIPALVIFLIAASFASARQSIVTEGDELRLDLVRYDPAPVEPGKTSYVWFEIINLGEKELRNFEITLADKFPFTLRPGTERNIIFETLKPGQAVPFKFSVIVNKNVPEGDYQLNLQHFSEKMNTALSEAFIISVKRVNQDVSATSIEVSDTTITVSPSMITPGKKAQVSITLKNSAEYLMKDIRVKLGLSDASTPFAPLGTTSEKKIKEIPIGQNAGVTFDIIALPGAKSDVYKVPLTIEYYDKLGNLYTKNDSIGLIIGDVPELKLEIKTNEIYKPKESGKIILNFVNSGLTDIKSLNVKLEAQATYEILSFDEVYIGDVDVDDDETAEFRLKLQGADEITLPLTVMYRDANNNDYSKTFILPLKIHSARDMGIDQGLTWWKTPLILFIVLILYIFAHSSYKKWKQKNEEEGILDFISHLIENFFFRAKKRK